jgi:hypothetical protein
MDDICLKAKGRPIEEIVASLARFDPLLARVPTICTRKERRPRHTNLNA